MARSKSGGTVKRLCGPQQKVRFSSERRANRALDTLWRAAIKGQFKGEKLPCRAYGPCKRCRGWHLTSQAKRDPDE